MRFNDLGINFIYLLASERDKKFGLTVNTVGFQPIAPHTLYPSRDHPTSYYFNPEKERILSEHQIFHLLQEKGGHHPAGI